MNLKTQFSHYSKIKLLSRSTENYFQLEPQPPNTCPFIDDAIQDIENIASHIENKDEIDNSLDSAIKSLKLAIRNLEHSEAFENREVKRALGEIEDAISNINDAQDVVLSLDSSNIVDTLEDIRRNCEAIRNWGQCWKDLFLCVFENPFVLFGKIISLWFCNKTSLKPGLEKLKST